MEQKRLASEMRKPFGTLAEELFFQAGRGDKTAIELFWVGVRDLPGNLTNTKKVLATILG